MIRHTTPKLKDHRIGFQRKDRSYTFMHWVDYGTGTSRFKWSKYHAILKEYNAVGPTILVEWGDD